MNGSGSSSSGAANERHPQPPDGSTAAAHASVHFLSPADSTTGTGGNGTAFAEYSAQHRISSDHGPGAGGAREGMASDPSRSELGSGFSMLGSTLPSFELMQKMRKGLSPEELQAAFARREAALQAAKAEASRDWTPEYVPPSILPERFKKGQFLRKAASVSAAMVLKDVEMVRKTKIVCTMGPACWDEDRLGALMDAGMNVARFNFSHGDHAGHLEVLERVRKVAAAKGVHLSYALDTKGPEIRTAMLKGGKDIMLHEGQEVVVHAVGPEAYTSWEGYVEKEGSKGRAVIGLSYDKLCQYVKPGNTILLSDGTITIKVREILDDSRLLGTCLNTHKLGQRKNCNLPGVVSDLPVLGPKDIDDVQNFAAKHGMDYVFASFVQSADDVRMIRQVLTDADAPQIKVICKIESQAGLINFDDILSVADGIMVARGDLAMEIPPEKVALAQKMMINRCQVAGKLVICATQMMESMIDNPGPSRAEMTDVANAVFDGTGAVMLSGETANGKHPALVVSTMAAIVANAELAVDYNEQYHVIRSNNAGLEPVTPAESVCAGVCQQALGFCTDVDGDGVIELGEGCLVVVLTADGTAAQLVSKYRPPCPVVVVSDSEAVLRGLAGYYALYLCKVDSLSAEPAAAVTAGIRMAQDKGLLHDGMKVLEVTGPGGSADRDPIVTTENLGLAAMSFIQKRVTPHYTSAFGGKSTPCRVNVRIGQELMTRSTPVPHKTLKVIATLGPATWTPEGMRRLLDAGVDIIRFNVKHQAPAENQMLLDMWHSVSSQWWGERCAAAGLVGQVAAEAPMGVMVSIRGHEIRTARLEGDKPVSVSAGDTIEFVGVGEDYISWRGGRTTTAAAAGEDGGGGSVVRLGLSYTHVGAAVKPGLVIQVDDGNLKVRVTSVTSPTTVLGQALNNHDVREMSLVHVPHAYRHEPVLLSARDREDIRMAAANQVTFVSIPFVRTAADVLEVRELLDSEGAPRVKIVAQIDTPSAIRNYDELLRVSDAIMVSRTNLGMVIKPEKVALAQKWLIQKARLASRPVLVAGQLMEGMAVSPRPSRPEITDVVNAVYDGADAVVLMQETSCGQFAAQCVATTARIIADAACCVDVRSNYSFIRNFTPKPLVTIEAAASSVVESLIDMQGCLVVVFTNSSAPARLVAKYRPGVPILVITRTQAVANACSMIRAAVTLVLGDKEAQLERSGLVQLAVEFSRKLSQTNGLPAFNPEDGNGDQMVMFSGPTNDVFLDVHNFSSAEVAALVFGCEASALEEPVGYRGKYTLTMRSTKVGLDLITSPVKSPRKTKIVCTLGPSCWSEEGLAALIDAGMNVARFNFSHGDHAGHGQVLERLRKVITEKHAHHVATLLDTKGPEIRTAMLRGGKDIELSAGQEVVVHAVGLEAYTSWEGYVEESSGRAVIGLSYDKLCRDVKPGGKILLADGSITIQVLQILDDSRLLGRCMNSKKLGQRKNCNLPGVLVDLPVLGPKDVDDVQNFAAKNGMDFVAASFVQSADDVRFIRRVLDEAGGHHVKIISKIESWHGVINYDDILAVTDGIMIARGDLAMEVPSEKVALAQKMMTSKANIAGKFVITATQMLESMAANPLPTRAEMTDVANAVFDGTDAVMLSGETANGAFPNLAVSTMAAIVTNAEVGVNNYQAFQWIRDFTDRPMTTRQAVLANVAKNVVDTDAGLVLLMASGREGLEDSLEYVRYVVKYRPRAPVLLLTVDEQLARACAPWYGVIPKILPELPRSRDVLGMELTLEEVVVKAVHEGLCQPGKQVVCALQTHQPALAAAAGAVGIGTPAAEVPMLRFKVAPGRSLQAQKAHPGKMQRSGPGHNSTNQLATAFGFGRPFSSVSGSTSGAGAGGSAASTGALGHGGGGSRKDSASWWQKTLSLRNTSIALDDILESHEHEPRKTKIVCTLGPSCWSEEGLAALIDAGMNVARFNFSHGDHAGHGQVLERLRKVAEAKGATIAYLLDTKGPEIRTAMLRGGKNLELTKGQEVVLVAVGAAYKTWEGGMNPDTGVAELGVSYEKLASSVAPGRIIKVADDGLSIKVTEQLDAKRLRGICLNSKSIGQNKNVNLPGVHVDLPVLTNKDIDDLVNFAVRHKFDLVAASFVQSGDDIRFIRQVLDRSGGASINIIAKIENEAGLENYDDILSVTDGIMVARGDLAMEVPSEKVALAQKMLITKANIAGKFVITATQMLESMTANPLPTRAEMTDVANAVFDGTDAVMLSGETANGAFPTDAVSTMAHIVTNAEVANSYYSSCNFLVDHTTKPFSRLEAMASAVCGSVTDANAQLVVVISATGEAPRLVSKYRPFVPQVVVTDSLAVLRASTIHFGQYGLLVPLLRDPAALAVQAADWASAQGLWGGSGALVLVAGHYEANADMMPTLQVVDVAPAAASSDAGAGADADGSEPLQASGTTTPLLPPAAGAGAEGGQASGSFTAASTAAAALRSPRPAVPSPPPEPADSSTPATPPGAADGLGVEGGRDLGRRLSIQLRRASTAGSTPPNRQFSKNS